MSRLAKQLKVGEKTIDVPVTMVDQVVNFFSPIKGAERYRARAKMALGGAYTSADKTRRANQSGGVNETDADGAILPDLQTLRESSQHMYRNSPIAGAAINTNITKVVGSGLRAKPQIDRGYLGISDDEAERFQRQALREYRLATETVEIDAERQLNIYEMQALVLLKALEDGDVFVNLPRFTRKGSPYKLKLQLIEAARVCNKDRKPDSAGLAGGIKKDDNGAPVSFFVANKHPGSVLRFRANQSRLTWDELKFFGERTGLPMALHVFEKVRPGQSRGVPYLAPVLELIKQLGRYTDAEVMAAVVSGMLTVFVTSETGAPEIGEDLSENSDAYDTKGMQLGYGSVIGLQPDTKIESFNPNRPNTSFDPFVMAVLRQIGARLEIPFELLVKHFTASYSAAKAAIEEAWTYFSRRREFLISKFCRPVYEAVITEAVASGRLSAPGFFVDPQVRRAWLGCQWLGETKMQLDPLKEINAAAKRVELTVSTLEEESLRFTGTPWEDKLPQILRERKILRDAGITITTLEEIEQDDNVDDE